MNNYFQIEEADITNFKNISSKKIDIGGKSLVILAPNEDGKSSLIQAIQSPVNSKVVPIEPIKKGEEKSLIKLKLKGKRDGKDIVRNIECLFTKKNQKGSIVIKDENGDVLSKKKEDLDTLIKYVAIDIFEFVNLGLTSTGQVSRAGIKEQVDILKSFLSDKEQASLEQIEQSIKSTKESISDTNKEIKRTEVKMNEEALSQDFIDNFKDFVCDSEIKSQIKSISETVKKRNDFIARLENIKSEYKTSQTLLKSCEFIDGLSDIMQSLEESVEGTNLDDTCKAIQSQAMQLCQMYSKVEQNYNEKDVEKTIGELKNKIEIGDKWLEQNPEPSSSDLQEKLEKINDHNKNHNKYLEHKKLHKSFLELQNNLEILKDKLKKYEKDKKSIFSSSSLPVKGLSFTEDMVLYQGLPFNENQHPKSVIITIGVQIAMALNDTLRTLFIPDGSLLDKKHFKDVVKIAEDKGYNLIIEMVKWDGEDMEIKFAEEILESKK